MSPDYRDREIQTLLDKAQTHNQQNDRQAAESCLRKVLSISPVEVNALYGLVVFSLDASRHADIRKLIAEQFERQGKNPEFHFNLGKALSRAKLYAQASESFRRAASRAPDPSGCYNQVGLAEEALQAFEKAVEAYERAVQLNPTKAEIFNNRRAISSDVLVVERDPFGMSRGSRRVNNLCQIIHRRQLDCW